MKQRLFLVVVVLCSHQCSYALSPEIKFNEEIGELLYVDLKINGQLLDGVHPVVLHEDQLYFPAEQIKQLRLSNAVLLAKKNIYRRDFYLLPKELTFSIDRENLLVTISVSAEKMDTVTISEEKNTLEVSPKTYGFYWNYHLSFFHDPLLKTAIFESAHKPVIATPYGSLVNQVVTHVGAINKIVRLETSYGIDFPKKSLRLTLGDSATDAPSFGNHVAMAGVKLQKDFLFQTGALSYPTIRLPGFSPRIGEAQIWVNDSLSATKELPRGRFLLDNLNLPAGSHSGTLVVRDDSGIVSSTPFSYYADPEILRHGEHAFSYSLGFIRKEYGIKSFRYGAPVFFGSHKVGIGDFYTPGLHVEASKNVLMFGSDQRFRLFNFGSTALGSAMSISKNGRGFLVAPEINLHVAKVLASVRAQWASPRFISVGVNEEPSKYSTYTLSSSFRVDVPYLTHTSLGYLLVHQGVARLHSIGLRQSIPLINSLALSVNGDYDFISNNFGIYCFIGAPLPFQHRISAQAKVKGRDIASSTTLSMNADEKKDVRFSYSLSGGVEDRAFGQGNVDVDAKYIISRVMAYGARDRFHYLAELNGAFGGMKNELFFSRPVNGGILLIELPDQKNVRVWKDNNTLLGKTDDDGHLVVTDLRPFESSHLGFDIKDLNPSTKSDRISEDLIITSGFQTAHSVKVSAPIVRNIQFRLLLDGDILSAGTKINILDLDNTFVMTDGRVYVELPHEKTSINGVDDAGICEFHIELKNTAGSLLEDIGDVLCH